MLAAEQAGEIFCFLLGRRPAADLVYAKVGMGTIRKPDRSRRAANFLYRYHVLKIAQAKPAIFFIHGDAMQAKLAHCGP